MARPDVMRRQGPQAPGRRDRGTVYAAIRQIGFNVAGVAEQLLEIRNDFIIASNLVKDLGKPLRTAAGLRQMLRGSRAFYWSRVGIA